MIKKGNLYMPLINYLEIYQFGSSLFSKDFNDIDLLIIYDENKILNSEIYQNHVIKIKKAMNDVFKKRIHITCLNRKEEKEYNFLAKIKSKKINWKNEYFA